MAQESITSASDRLEKLFSEIDYLVSKALASFKDDNHNIRCLRRAILDVP